MWFLKLVRHPRRSNRREGWIAAATERGVRLGAAAYGYRPAFKNSPSVEDLMLLHRVLEQTWGYLPSVLNPLPAESFDPPSLIKPV